jgi:hypothetical protein
VAVNGITKANNNKKLIEKISKNCLIKYTDSNVNAIPPINPSHDFFGEIRGIILCLPNFDPMIYAKVSNTHVSIKSINIGDGSKLVLE